MRKLLIMLVLPMLMLPSVNAQKPKKQLYTPNAPVPPSLQVDDRIDNMSYWRRMASLGLVPVQQETKTPGAIYGTSKLIGRYLMTEDSPDVPVTNQTSTQSENSIFINPMNAEAVLQSNNSTTQPFSTIYGANSFMSNDAGSTWGGSLLGAGGSNSGDPTTAISLSGRYYVGYIHSNGGQGVSYSTNQGETWTSVLVAPGPPGYNSLLDKNHMWIDNSPTSPHEGNLYNAWTNFGGTNNNQIEVSRSTDEGLTWSTPVNISSAVNAGNHNQGVNIQTGPNGEVYVLWILYDNWPSDEKALALAKSLDGGATWEPAVRIHNNIRGIRNTGVGKNMRVNGFPTMAVDISDGPFRGNIYVSWANIGTPGINSGNDADAYVMKSTDGGTTWGTPVKVNQDPSGLGKKHYFPWITCDPINGNLSVIYYDDRNVSSTQCEVYVSNSIDGAATWWDVKVSDVSFTPSPIPGLASGYMGDYLAIQARDGWVYPVWADNRLGYVMSFVSPFVIGPPQNQPWLMYYDNSLNDAEGNGNGLMDFGESTLMNLSIENQGGQPASNVNVILTTDNPYITITDDNASFGNIPSDAIITVEDAFAFSVANNIPDAEQVIFTIAATDANDSTYYSNFNIEAHAPGFRTGLIALTEVTGNGNNRLDAGETATIRISTINSGDYKAYDVAGMLTTASPYITISNPSFHWDSIMPGPMNAVLPVFNISVAPETPVGHFAEFTYQLNSQYHQATKQFSYPVGMIIEDWEIGNFNNFEWDFGGSSTWQVTNLEKYEGAYSAVSGSISHNATSELSIDYNVLQDDSISFYVKVSSQANFDFLKFYIDNDLVGQWSGQQEWLRVVFPVSAGPQTFKWIYSKNGTLTAGLDKAWVDFIVFPPLLQTTAYAGADGNTCERESFMLSGAANNFVSAQWTTSGDGTFDNATELNCFYTPGGADILSGNAILTLTVNGPEGEVKTDNLSLTISNQAIIQTITDIAVCNGLTVDINASAQNYTSLNWTSTGTGNFTDPSALTTTYQPSPADYAAGTIILSLAATSQSPCGNISRDVNVAFLPLPTASISQDVAICAGETATGQVNLTGTAPWSFEISNGIGVVETSDNPYTFSVNPTETTTYSINTVTDANQCQNTVDGSYIVTVNQLPVVSISEDSTLCAGTSITITAGAEGEVTYQWSPGNQVTPSITIDTTGNGLGAKTFTVEVTNAAGCSKTASTTVTFQDCTGLDEMLSSDLVIYPNPSKGVFTLKLNSNSRETYLVEVYDMSNKLVYTQPDVTIGSSDKYTVNVSGLSDGVYKLYLKNDSGVLSTKIVIRK